MAAVWAAIPNLPTTQIRRILFATDFSAASQRALPVTAALARKYGSEVYLANICFPLPYRMGLPDGPIVLEAEQLHDAMACTRKMSACAELGGVQTTAIVEQGEVAQQIAKLVQERNVDLVVLGTHGRTGWKHVLMGSVAESLFRSLSCPVLTVGPGFSPRLSDEFAIRRILFPTDFSEASRMVLYSFASLAALEGCEIIITHVLAQDSRMHSDRRKLADALRRDIETMCSLYVPNGCKAEFVIEVGDPTKCILDVARKRNVDLIAMGVRNAPEFVTHFRYTITYRVVLEAGCPVLTWRTAEHSS